MMNRKRSSGAGSASAKNRKRQGMTRRSVATIPRSFGAGDIIFKRMTIPNGSLSSNAGQIVPVTTYSNSLVQSNPATEWASFASRYQQYGVVVMRIHLTAVAVVNLSTENINQMYISDYIGTSAPTSAAQVLSDEKAKIWSSSKDLSFVTSWVKNPNAKLWNPTSASIPTANQMGIAIASGTTALFFASSPVFTYSIMFDVEFRGAQ